MAGVFHSYDIRGIFGKEIDILFAYKLGLAFVQHVKPKICVIGHDERIGSDVLSQALADALNDSHIKVIDIGLCTTPMLWHAVNFHKADGGIMTTASHNPKEYVGFKLCQKFAIPIGYETGLSEIEKRMESLSVKIPTRSDRLSLPQQGHYREFAQYLGPYVPNAIPLRVVADCSNSAVAPILVSLFAGTNNELILINEEADGNFPGHEPNPLIESTTVELSKRVLAEKADFGVIFDGDADRVVFVDETGARIVPDAITALLGVQLIKRKLADAAPIHPRKQVPIVLADLRSSNAVDEMVREEGGQVFLTKVGRPHIITQLRATHGLMAGELSGHYYFNDFFCCDDGVRTLLEMMQLLSLSQQRLSELVVDFNRYMRSGETNFIVTDPTLVLSAIRQEYEPKKPWRVSDLDGISIYFETFWFNVRASNTEPLLRVNLEADDKHILESEFAALVTVIKRFMR